MMKKGFTLVELSIVLVIIGLLIGGVLVGQSLINAAKTQKFVRQLQQFDIAVMNFKDKYKNLPGDSNKISSVGDGDGIIEDTITGTDSSQRYAGETAAFWYDLNKSGFDPSKNYTSTLTGAFNSNPNLLNGPLINDLGKNVSAVIYSVSGVQNFYRIANYSAFNNVTTIFSAVSNQNFITPIDALAIDEKIDNGSLTASSNSNMFSNKYISGSGSQCLSTDESCMLFIRILSQILKK